MKKRLMILMLTIATVWWVTTYGASLGIITPASQFNLPCSGIDTINGLERKPDSVHIIVKFGRGANVTSYFRTSGASPSAADWIDSTLDADWPTWTFRDTVGEYDADSGAGLYGLNVRSFYQTKAFTREHTFNLVDTVLNFAVSKAARDSATIDKSNAWGLGVEVNTKTGFTAGPTIRLVVHAVKNNNTFDVDTTLLGFSNGRDLLGCMVFFNRHGGKPSFFRSGINRAVNGGGYDTLTMIDTLTAVAGDTITIYPTPWWDFMPADTATDLFALNVWNTDSTQSFANASMGRLMILAAIAGADTSAFKTLLNNNGYRTAKDSINAALTIGLLKSLPRIGGLVDSVWFKLVETNLGRINGSAAAATELKKAFDVTNPAGGGRIANVLHVDSADYVDTVRGVGSGGGSGTGSCMDLAGVRFVVNVWDGTNSAAVPNAAVTIRTSLTGTAYDHRLDTNPFGNAVFTIDPAAYYIFVESPGLNFPDSAYTIIGADSILISGTGATIVPAANATKAAVVGYLWKITSKNGVSSACANCDVIFELLGPNCSDTVQTALWVTKTVKASANANGYISAYLPLTGRMKCEDGSTPRWKMTVTVGNKRTEVTFDTPDTSTVDIGSLMK